MIDAHEQLVKVVEDAMLDQQLSQSELARRAECNSSTIHTILVTRRIGSLESLLRIMRALNLHFRIETTR